MVLLELARTIMKLAGRVSCSWPNWKLSCRIGLSIAEVGGSEPVMECIVWKSSDFDFFLSGDGDGEVLRVGSVRWACELEVWFCGVVICCGVVIWVTWFGDMVED